MGTFRSFRYNAGQYRLLPFLFLFAQAGIAQVDEDLHVHCIDVGQGAATLLEFPCGAVLIDAGAGDESHADRLMDYLGNFFAERPDLDSTLALVLITHCHKDHNWVLRRIAESFTVQRYIDDHFKTGSGKTNQKWLQAHASAMGITYATYSFTQITADGRHDGLTDAVIDPLQCAGVDPEIHLLSGYQATKPADWSADDFKEGNNHSYVVRVDFGGSSILLPGDLELDGIRTLIAEYVASDMLDADLLVVAHHGSINGTTDELLRAVSPTHAVIDCGHWNSGVGETYSTNAYGHPRAEVVDMLAERIPGNRSRPVTVMVGEGARHFHQAVVRKRIYSTAWDGNLVIDMDRDGNVKVNRNR
ncbi:MAG TPA: MBL fold metallo-hydrolase [Flavobacteriales bacterium]|nr:MBL fold metallo-hydrolase [Flavobacteriales bacterium]